MIRGSEGMAAQFSQCCHPIPGDRIEVANKRGVLAQVTARIAHSESVALHKGAIENPPLLRSESINGREWRDGYEGIERLVRRT